MSLLQPTADLTVLLVPHTGTLGVPLTGTTEAGPRAGAPVPATPSAMVLEATGELDTTLDDIEIATSRAGGIGTATFRWRYAGEGLRSWDPPILITEWEHIDRSTTADYWTRFDGVRRASGRVVAAAVRELDTVYAGVQEADGDWTLVEVEQTGDETVASIFEDPDGRLIVLYTFSVATSACQLRMQYSDDGGATWTLGSRACLSQPLGVAAADILRIRARWFKGRVAVVLWHQDGGADHLLQYVSADGGATLTAVETVATSDVAAPDLQVRGDTLYLATIERDATLSASIYVPKLRKSSSPSTPWTATESVTATSLADVTEWGAYSGGAFTAAECALLVDDDGAIWIYGRDFDGSGTNETVVVTSWEGGGASTWYTPYKGGHHPDGVTIHASGDASTYLKDLAVVPERGRAILLHRYGANPGTGDDSLCAAYLGGWSTFAMPEDASLNRRGNVSGWEEIWLGFEKPGDITGHTEVTSGSPTISRVDGGVKAVVAGGESWVFYQRPTLGADAANGILALFQVMVEDGDAVHDVTISDGTDCYAVRVTVSPTTITVRDLGAGVDLGTPLSTTDGADGVQILVALSKPTGAWSADVGHLVTKYRKSGPWGGALNPGPNADRVWTDLEDSTTIASTAGTYSEVKSGFAAAGTATWRMRAFDYGEWIAGDDPAGDPDRGRAYCPASSPAHVVEGLRIHAVDGPTYQGDTWDHACEHAHPASAVDVSVAPSPARRWRSTTRGTNQDLIWEVDLGFDAGDLVGVFVSGANFRNASVYRDSSATNKIVDIDLALSGGLVFTRTRDLVIPGPGGTEVPFYLHEGLLAGGTFYNGTLSRRIKANRAGSWLSEGYTAYPSTRVVLESYDAGDASSGSSGELWSPTGLFIAPTLQSTNRIMLRIPPQDVAEDYFELGSVIIGNVHLLTPQWGNGRAVEWVPRVRVSETPRGGLRVQRLAPQGRRVEVGWPQGLDTTGLHTQGEAPEWMTAGYTGARPWASPPALLSTLAGILQTTEGPRLPVVLAPGVRQQVGAPTATSPIRIVDPSRLLYSRIRSEVLRADQVTGNEHRDPGEVFRIPPLRFEEVV